MSLREHRMLSIDVLRAITMFLMIFVNDVAGVANIPKWLEHTPADFDGMGFSDLIFPAFLFIVGLSLPYAIQARINKGDGKVAILAYIFLRGFALIVMGFFHVNLGSYNHQDALLSYPLYTIILTLGFFLIWLAYPPTVSKILKYSLVSSGILIILTMAYLYKGGSAEQPKGLEPSWWGILGIIGWAYLFSAVVYLFARLSKIALIICFIVFALINVTTHMDLLHVNLWQIGDASSITLMLGGVLISTFYKHFIKNGKYSQIWIYLSVIGVVSILFGFFIRPFAGGISKIYATPAWVFICMGISILMFQLIIFLVEIKKKANWFKFIKAAGTSTLTCYLIPYLLYATFKLIDFSYPPYFNQGIGGIIRSLFVAFLVIRIVAFLEQKSIRLKI